MQTARSKNSIKFNLHHKFHITFTPACNKEGIQFYSLKYRRHRKKNHTVFENDILPIYAPFTWGEEHLPESGTVFPCPCRLKGGITITHHLRAVHKPFNGEF